MSDNHNRNVAAELAEATIGVRTSFSWLGQSRKLDDSQQAEAAAVFGASAEAVSMSKKLFDTKNEVYRAVTAVRGKIKKYVERSTLPFTEPKIRLLKREALAEFNNKTWEFKTELREAVEALEREYSNLKAEAADRLGSLFNASDYPATLENQFSVAFDFPNLSPPDYLSEFPEIYQREADRFKVQFEQAAELAEQAFLAELAAMVESLTTKLSGDTDGKPRIFRNSLVENFNAFFDRFKTLSITSSPELEALVDQAKTAIGGTTAAELRENGALRRSISTNMANIGAQIVESSEPKPKRRIKLRGASEQAANAPTVEAEATEPNQVEATPAAAVEAPTATVEQPAPNGWERIETSVPGSTMVAQIDAVEAPPVEQAEAVEAPQYGEDKTILSFGNGRTLAV